MKKVIQHTLLVAVLGLLLGCGDQPQSKTPADKSALGKALFHDKNLSSTKSMACASCHNPDHGLADSRCAEDATHNTQTGCALSLGDDGVSLGGRNAPTASYMMYSPTFSVTKGEAKGGQFWDGRAATLQAQAKGPFLDTAEMQMPDKASVINRVKENPYYVTLMKNIYGNSVFDDTNEAYEKVADAIAAYENDTTVFAPFDSKYDRSLRGEYTLSDEEDAGRNLFFSANTNCSKCHTIEAKKSNRNPDERLKGELFTAFEFRNIGVPRNQQAYDARAAVIPGFDANHTDYGLGGRSDMNASFNGQVKVPTLRNVAVTAPYMHNGVFTKLETVIQFYEHIRGNKAYAVNPETNSSWGSAEVDENIAEEIKDSGESDLKALQVSQLVAFLKALTDKKYEHLLN